MMEALEKEAEQNNLNLGISSNIFTIFIELTQNMMNYSKSKNLEYDENSPEGLILVTKDIDDCYYIHSQNIITEDDKNRIEPKLEKIVDMSKEEIKKEYRLLRKSGKDSHGKGAGIGFYEIAKRSDGIKFEFNKITDEKYYFHFISKIKTNKEK
ncbi:hypothetical protein CRV08_15585 [Halarcobacter ebronensis]|uniref:Histidine kinase/HSP90-like ATPase domain-containing protein n=2 Tax=Halarcobacter ebronensis TaxID=1462615 RepID=A0A4Q1AL27_9BACT|nr:hypothetical protein CRV08_15585 [Halarcobacter ebronensis]RXK05601.1 hypothetical protein CRV07_07985 [Halarcobacter ebronensis]